MVLPFILAGASLIGSSLVVKSGLENSLPALGEKFGIDAARELRAIGDGIERVAPNVGLNTIREASTLMKQLEQIAPNIGYNTAQQLGHVAQQLSVTVQSLGVAFVDASNNITRSIRELEGASTRTIHVASSELKQLAVMVAILAILVMPVPSRLEYWLTHINLENSIFTLSISILLGLLCGIFMYAWKIVSMFAIVQQLSSLATTCTGGGGTTTTNPSPSMSVPVGTIMAYAGTTLPDGWLWCDGAALLLATRPELTPLALILGSLFSPTGTTAPHVPDLRGRMPVGYSMGHSRFGEVGAIGGKEQVSLTSDQNGPHNHGIANARVDIWRRSFKGEDGAELTAYRVHHGNYDMTSHNSGAGAPHENMPPFVVTQYIIKY